MKPVDRVAARVMRGGVHWTPKINAAANQKHFDVPQPTKERPPQVEDMTGRRFGRFVVVGFRKKANPKGGGATWLVRCACGQFEERKAAAIRNRANEHDCCIQCRKLQQLKRNEYWRRTGQSQPLSFFE
jgi:hypothetical protein